jgi:protein-disulfide isomerase
MPKTLPSGGQHLESRAFGAIRVARKPHFLLNAFLRPSRHSPAALMKGRDSMYAIRNTIRPNLSLLTSLVAAILFVLAAGPGRAEEGVPAATAVLSDLAKAGPLGDEWLGDANAPVTVIEYASLTCTHCAHFHESGYPTLKAKYIDTGKVRFTLREFPFDPVATAAFMLARCSGEGHYYSMIDLLFKQQKTWAFSEKPADALLATVKQAGFTQDTFNTCLKDQRIYDAVNDVKTRGEKLGVDATPTFFINGVKTSGAMEPKDVEAAIEPLLKK